MRRKEETKSGKEKEAAKKGDREKSESLTLTWTSMIIIRYIQVYWC